MNNQTRTGRKNSGTDSIFPPLPIDEWEGTKNTLHLYLQIVGKIRLSLFPKMNHWWHVTLYLSPRGLTTRAIPYGSTIFEIEFDFIDHKLIIKSSDGRKRSILLVNGLSVSEFYKTVFSNLSELRINVQIKAVPYDLPFSAEPFETDFKHAQYYEEYVNRFWRILVQVYSVFQEFKGRFIGKSTPIHLYWHHSDLAVTRFSGRRGPERKGGTNADREAYSHEVISFGFWSGDEKVRAPAFYSYTYPEPEGLADEPLSPRQAFWNTENGSMALFMYDDLRKLESPKQALLDFLESAYQAGAKRANWDIEDFKLKTL